MSTTSEVSVQGLAALGAGPLAARAELEVFEAKPGITKITFRSAELTATCPVTKQPDFYRVVIEYDPLEWCIETKSLKLYLRTFDGRGIFAEHLAAKIAQDVAEAARCAHCRVTLTQQIRGGIETEVQAQAWSKEIFDGEK